MAERRGLGRGLGALIPRAETAAATAEGREPREIPIERIQRNPNQPRKHFDEESLESLAQSIRERGILQPLVLTPRDDGYLILAGERRWRAAQRAGLTRVPAILRPADTEAERLELALIENLQRENLNAIEEAESFRDLIETHGYPQETLARLVGRSRPAIANSLRLLGLAPDVQELIIEGKLSAGHGRTLAGLPNSGDQKTLALQVVREELSVRETEQRADRIKRSAHSTAATPPDGEARTRHTHYRHLEEELQRRTGLRLRIHPTGDTAGRIELPYHSLDEFDAIVARLKGH